MLILISSYVFYGWWDWRFLILIVISSLVDFLVGKAIDKTENKGKRKSFLAISLFVNLGFLVYFKYTNFFIDTFVDAFTLFGKNIEISTLNIILPVGISFYTFQTLSYTIDIYRNQLKSTNNALAFFSFVAFFPQLVAGPIERASHLLPQFYKTYKFNYVQIKSGLLLIAFGLFKKMVIADRAAIIVNQVYNSPNDYKGIEAIIATILFAFQIYCDFSAYSDIAIGTARTMGFDLMKNFDSPYFSKSITEFWRRWHISLSTWFRDYVYIPLGGSRKGKYKTYANLFIVFLVSGLWHGAAINFVIWGAIHGLIMVLEKATYKSRIKLYKSLGLDKNSFSNRLFFASITFIVVCFAWVFFRADTFANAWTLIGSIFDNNFIILFTDQIYELGLEKGNLVILLVFMVLLLFFEVIHNRKSVASLLNKQSIIFRWSTYVAVIMVIIIFGVYGGEDKSQFIYFQF
ncbi:MBOAT family O-acyltransferase [Flavivirga jejuensis]|uniref:MBOAT family O-acyltransferase n=1 Tax=Flavivirga jejuensis TaxID=870487 RepID=A0ABT8WQB6_9FLAO|nr:MBOAT family O-acyltransferase [Flavivirga jejuensis]MDO5975344.1 MBOAT family O-acyltransferase [Flavivirga jejuensis]